MFQVIAFYKFCRIEPERVAVLQAEINTFCQEYAICGLLLLSVEGCNGTMAGRHDAVTAFVAFLQGIVEIGTLSVKVSTCDEEPFGLLKVEVREEIVTLKRPDIFPEGDDNTHLPPAQWHEVLTSGDDFVLIDVRNTYETEIGKFRQVLDPQLEQFSDFPDFVAKQAIPKDKTVLMYCTGGIRCEKAAVFMKQEGYRNVFQLDGGILNYLEQFPEGEYEGECFVFDRRVAVDRNLQPSQQYRICPHCGSPGKEVVACGNCGKQSVICQTCAATSHLRTCSKNCAHHYALKQG